jgi:hypothetical protein
MQFIDAMVMNNTHLLNLTHWRRWQNLSLSLRALKLGKLQVRLQHSVEMAKCICSLVSLGFRHSGANEERHAVD